MLRSYTAGVLRQPYCLLSLSDAPAMAVWRKGQTEHRVFSSTTTCVYGHGRQTPKVEWLLPPHGAQSVWSGVGPKPGGQASQVMPSELYVHPVHGMQLIE